MSLEMEIRAAVGEICIEKNNRHIKPVHATLPEIMERVKASDEEVKQRVDKMVTDGRLEWCKTEDELYFRNIPRQ